MDGACRIVPNTYATVKENAFNDFAHDTVLHHGVGPGFDRAAAVSLPAKTLKQHASQANLLTRVVQCTHKGKMLHILDIASRS